MPKITFMGAGSAVFTYEIMTDILSTPGLDSGVFALVDIDEERLQLVQKVAELAVAKSGKKWKVEAATDRKNVLAGTAYLPEWMH
jgi:alpha-galactosidase